MPIRGGVKDTKLKAKNTKIIRALDQGQALRRTDPLEAKDRNAQGQGPRTQAQVSCKKKSSKKSFQAISKKKGLQNFFQAFSSKKRLLKVFFRRPTKFQPFKKSVLSLSRGQGIFQGLEASRPRTSKCVLEDSTSGANVF